MAEAANIISIAMRRRGVPAVLAACALLTVGSGGVSFAQQPMPQQQPQQQAAQQQQFSVEQINQLVAPIALYPDDLLAQVLAASTYPLEVVVAARWAQSNKNVTVQSLEEAMQLQCWDPSIKALCAVPQVLVMMSEKIEWTQQLGAAYLTQPDDIAIAVQNLRARADASGNLKETNQVKVRRVAAPPPPDVYLEPPPPQYIVIEPYDPTYLVVPYYDPFLVYGVWPYAAYRPWYWYPPGYVAVGVIGFGAPIFVGSAIWATYRWGSWGYGGVHVNVVKFNSFNRTRIVSTGGNMQWKQNSQFAKPTNASFKPGQGGFKPGQGGLKPGPIAGNSGNQRAITNLNQSGGIKPANNATTLNKPASPQGFASTNPGGGSKPPKPNISNTVRTNVATQRLNTGQTFRAPTGGGFKPAPRVNVPYKKP